MSCWIKFFDWVYKKLTLECCSSVMLSGLYCVVLFLRAWQSMPARLAKSGNLIIMDSFIVNQCCFFRHKDTNKIEKNIKNRRIVIFLIILCLVDAIVKSKTNQFIRKHL